MINPDTGENMKLQVGHRDVMNSRYVNQNILFFNLIVQVFIKSGQILTANELIHSYFIHCVRLKLLWVYRVFILL